MKQLWLILLGTIFLFAQQITVKETIALTTPQEGAFSHPIVSPEGKVFFTQLNYQGLYYLDSGNKIITVSEEPGAGYEPEFSKDGRYVYYRPYRYENARKLSSLVKKDLIENNQNVLIKDRRDFTSPKRLDTGAIVVDSNSEILSVDENGVNSRTDYKAVAFVDNSKISVFHKGEKKSLAPLGDGHYIWPAVSPDGNRLLFVKAGKGAFICDLDGNIQVELGYANAPKWSPDGNWIVYMDDKDDGHRLLESDIWIVSADGQSRYQLTQTSDILELYPAWGTDKNTVYSGSDSGIIYKINLEIQ
ncbi:MAG: PD40 domain-containing protein [Calditrichae bacterium]|nr:PD40 domain-containing protein [Calditrichota bacterium]MCB9057433.1 PD40 domain-containing protein [Calditrichia bacterium]